MPEFEEYCEEIKDLWDSRWLTNMGSKHKALELELKDYLNVPNITLFTNGHLALENVISAMELKGEVITTPFTFVSTTHAISRCGCKPVFCDIDPEDYTIDVSRIESLITEKTSAIIPVHVYGNLCDTDAIQKIADRYGLKVIYDAAHAFGVTKNGISAANFGDASMFSFHATKVFHTIEGGAVCYRDEALRGKLNDLKNFGIHGPEEVPYIGGNAKLNEFCAAMGLCNLRHLDGEITKRKAAAEHYDARLSGIPGIKLNRIKEGVKHNWAYYPVVFENYKYDRDTVFARLAENGIAARKYFYPAINTMEPYRSLPGAAPEELPVAYRVSNSVLTLPMFADLTTDVIDRICDIILS